MKFDKVHSFLKRRRERGMTMVEMMVALLISSLLILGVVSIYRFAYKDWTDGMRLERLQQQTQDTMGFLERDVKQAVLTTGTGSGLQAPMITTNNGYGLSSYGVIIIENVGTSGLPITSQVWYQLTTNSTLLRGVASYSGTLASPTSWTTLLTGVTYTTPPPFSVSTFDLTTDLTALTSDTTSNQSLTIATLNVQAPNNVPNSLTTYIVQQVTTLTMRSNAQVQDYQLQGGQL